MQTDPADHALATIASILDPAEARRDAEKAAAAIKRYESEKGIMA